MKAMPIPAIASDRLVDLHNDLTHYDTMLAEQMTEFITHSRIDSSKIFVDQELEDNLRAFKAKSPIEVECRREMLKYKRRIDSVIREVLEAVGQSAVS